MEIFLFWIVFAIAVGVIASNRGRSGFGWFLLSVLLSPLIGVLLVLALGHVKVDQVAAGTHVKCPACAEPVLKEAIKCKHCGSVILPPTPVAPDQSAYRGARIVGEAVGRSKAIGYTTAIVCGIVICLVALGQWA